MNFYNHRRPHQAMNNQFPMAAWRARMDRIEAAKTVDMPLRLDNVRIPGKATTLSGAWRPRDPVDDDRGGARA
jgi:hypothetical protein